MSPTLFDNIYYRTTDLHAAFEGKRVFIAGRGFYSRAFESFFVHLRNRGVDVTVTAFSPRDNWHIQDVESYGASNLHADFVINAAGAASGGSIHDMRQIHGLGPIYLFDCMAMGARGLQISTGAINSDTPYARAKWLAEIGIGLLERDVQIVRPFATVGPNMPLDSHFAIATFIRRALQHKPLEVTSRPCQRSFVHIADLIVQMLHVLVNGDGKPYDVGGCDTISMLEAARAISDDVTVVDTVFPTNAASDWYSPNLSRVMTQFNLSCDWSSESAIRDTFRSFQTHSA